MGEVSDVIAVAPGYTPVTLSILKSKKRWTDCFLFLRSPTKDCDVGVAEYREVYATTFLPKMNT